MLVIRLQRVGRKNDPAYRVVIGERRSKPQSSGIEMLGSYHPKTKETILKHERILYWMSKGAQISNTAYNMLVAKGVVSGKKKNMAPVSLREIPQSGTHLAPAKPVQEQPRAEHAEKIQVN